MELIDTDDRDGHFNYHTWHSLIFIKHSQDVSGTKFRCMVHSNSYQ
ncbi:hypothetical protein M3J09_009391 [Ascochyta lentis]